MSLGPPTDRLTPFSNIPRLDLDDRYWRPLCALILVVAAALRYWNLDLSVFHMDEGVNGSFMMQLVRQNIYRYDPANYHGPTLYFLQLPFTLFFGFSAVAFRMEPATFSLITVGLILLCWPGIGRRAALAAAWLYALSPGSVYMARYFIHESLLVCFTLGVLVPWLWKDKIGLQGAAVLSCMSQALACATKETWFIALALFIIGRIAGEIYARSLKFPTAFPEPIAPLKLLVVMVSGFSIFWSVYVLFFTSFFTNRKGFIDAFRAFHYWGAQAHDLQHHPWWQWLDWLAQMEAPILVLGCIGVILMLVQYKTLLNRFTFILGTWAVGILTAYSLIAYKTPWCAINFILPLSLCAGVTISWLSHNLSLLRSLEVAALATLMVATQCVYMCYLHYDDEGLAYSYARTQRGMRDMFAWINWYSKEMGVGTAARISYCWSEYWPIPWYLRDYTAIGWWGKPTFGGSQPDIVIFRSDDNDPKNDQTAQVKALMKNDFSYVGKENLWNDIVLQMWVRTSELEHHHP